jgi:hypothetical protein
MGSNGGTLIVLLLAIPTLGVLLVISRVGNLKRAGTLGTVWQSDDDEQPRGLPLTRVERALLLALHTSIMGVLLLTLKSFIGMNGGIPLVAGWRGYVPTLVVGVMITMQGSLMWRATKRHLPHILDAPSPPPTDPLS